MSANLNVILNLLPLKTGGGVQQALDFWSGVVASSKIPEDKWTVVARQGVAAWHGGHFEKAGNVVFVKDRLSSRLFFELFGGRRLVKKLKADVVYTFFGPQWYFIDVPQVVGCAYSNLLYPEVPFWEAEPLGRRMMRRLVDDYRRARVQRSDMAIFETEDLARRAISVLGMQKQRVAHIKPVSSVLVDLDREHQETAEKLDNMSGKFRIVALSGYHPNKKLEILPKAISVLRNDYGVDDISVLTTLPPCRGTENLLNQARKLGVSDAIHNIGPVPQAGCMELYRICDAAYLGSRLESFSNTILESWKTETALLISDFSWARGICGDAAMYFEHANAESLAEAIWILYEDRARFQSLINAGKEALSCYPGSRERAEQAFNLLEHVVDGRNGEAER